MLAWSAEWDLVSEERGGREGRKGEGEEEERVKEEEKEKEQVQVEFI